MCLFSHEADEKAEIQLVETSNERPPILTKNLRASKKQNRQVNGRSFEKSQRRGRNGIEQWRRRPTELPE